MGLLERPELRGEHHLGSDFCCRDYRHELSIILPPGTTSLSEIAQIGFPVRPGVLYFPAFLPPIIFIDDIDSALYVTAFTTMGVAVVTLTWFFYQLGKVLHRDCPICWERIKSRASKCRHCGSAVEPTLVD